jgi:hypothetical protein
MQRYRREMTARRLDRVLTARGGLSAALKCGAVLDVNGVARRYGYSRQHIYRLVSSGVLDPVRRGRRSYLFLPDQLAGRIFKNG